MNCFAPFNTVIELSPRVEKIVQDLMGPRIIDIALFVPTRFEKRIFRSSLKDIQENSLTTLILTVVAWEFSKSSRKPSKIALSDGVDSLYITYFRGQPAYLKTAFPVGEKVLVSGKIEKKTFHYLMTHPDFVGTEKDKNDWQGTRPLYRLKTGLHQRFVQKFIAQYLKNLTVPDNWLAPHILSKLSLPSFLQSIQHMHTLDGSSEIAHNPFKKRLCFDEFLAHQLALILSSRKATLHSAVENTSITLTPSPLIAEFIAALPFELTNGQKNIIKEILTDMQKPHPMVRLLQGDVGSGKTVVAAISALKQIEQGGQVVFLSPTEILAIQHYKTISEIFGHKIRVQLLTGRHTSKQKKQIYEDLKEHKIDLLIGTHAIIQESVTFNKLTFCIIDEQHRFGVKQRMLLQEKGQDAHLLSMTATPIPRTLTLAQYGDMDISVLKEKPKGRIPIITSILSLKKYDSLLERLKEKMKEDTQIYWVCPLIEHSEALSYTAAEARHKALQKVFGESNVLMMHGKMKSAQKDEVMEAFKAGKAQILVSTTVIEVGVDVPNASIMIIENAERFGLSQLHQLRGRVGRGQKESYCILLFGAMLTVIGKKRLEVMQSTDDGFEISEMDLKLRGQGEITGTQQSGMPYFKFADFETASIQDQDVYNALLEEANTYAWELFLNPEYKHLFENACTHLLKIYKKDNAVQYTKTG
jgi:ATP-dependent DNA helicase RecG